MKAKLFVPISLFLVLPLLSFATGSSEQGGSHVLQHVTISREALPAFQQIGDVFAQKNPGYTMQVTAIPGVAEFNTAMASKFASGDAPDIFSYQWGTQIQLYASGGQAMDLSDTGLADRCFTINRPFNIYKGGIYALPLVQQSWGVFVNWDVAKKYGMDKMPETFQGWLDAMDTMQKNGLAAPIAVPAQDGSGATAFVFGYLSLVVGTRNPTWYAQTLDGKASWNGPEMQDLLTNYGKVLKYANKDKLGTTPDEAYQRFARGEAAFFINGNSVISTLRTLNPKMNFTLEVFPFKDIAPAYQANSGFDSAISAWSKTKFPKAARAYLDALFTVQSGDLLAKATREFSAVKGTQAVSDPVLLPQQPFLSQGKFVDFSERVWIPGIKEIMKKAVQNWMAGTDMSQALDGLEAEHQRLLNAHPEFKQQFMDAFANMKRS